MNLAEARRTLRSFGSPRKLHAHIDYWGSFQGDELLIAGWVHDLGATLELELWADGSEVALTSLTIVRGSRPDVTARYGGEPDARIGFVLRADLAQSLRSDAELTLRVHGSQGEAELGLTATAREKGEKFTASIRGYADRDRQAAIRLATSVLGVGAIDLGSVRLNVERAFLVGTRGVFLQGWLFDPEASLKGLRVRVANASSEDVLLELGRLPRPDVDRAIDVRLGAGGDWGFVCFAPVQAPAGSAHAELLIETRAAVISVPVDLLPLSRDAVRLSTDLLSPVDPSGARVVELLEAHIAPAIEAGYQPAPPAPGEVEVYRFGQLPASPKRSLVIPLFGRADFMLYQLNELARDPDLAETEIVYVIDDPRLTEHALGFARTLHELLEIPLMLVDTGRNRGFAGAINLGAAQSSGRYLVLLNSDVLPKERGWLDRLERELEALPDAGLVGPRLLFHDGTVQHDGIAFRRDPTWPTLWLNDHPGKGIPAHLVRGPRVERVPAVTAACAVIARAFFQELGGLDEGYIVGDYEDSDLCLRAAARGRASYVVRDVTLYHLERQSQSLAGSGSWRTMVTLYNAWRHGRRWASEIEASVRARRT
ncbi:MAG: glycosyltransferase family 2 protein [Polyangiaceae bacterium]